MSCLSIVIACRTSGCCQPPFLPSRMFWNTSGPPTRSSRYSAHISSVQDCDPASAIGVTPLAFSAATSASRSSQVAGDPLMPAEASTSLLLNSRTGWTPRIGRPYCLPSISAPASTLGRNDSFSSGFSSSIGVRSSILPASTYSLRLPPPQLKKTSGALGELMAVRSRCLYGSLPKVSSLTSPASEVSLKRSIEACSIGLRVVSWRAHTEAVPPPPPPPEVLEEPQAATSVPARRGVVADMATRVRRRGDIPPPPSCFVVENRKFRAVAKT